ncbi:hypothetical protein HU200_029204 [Digitaria exilis]|uniref:DUF1618 domain-containing protein n=1 Tax=Digitaria exilis TaxID=1010633 RepID=A0A835BTG4_9POAL|nr:hypothetical protein HU200_029204 [Digitaria exilis]
MYYGSGAPIDYFVYKASSDIDASRWRPSLLLLLPAYDDEDIWMSRDNTGIMSWRTKGKSPFAVAKLTIRFGLCSEIGSPPAIEAHMFRSGSDECKVFKDLQIDDANGGSRFLMWVDYYQGIILADMSPQSEGKDVAPSLWYVPFPVDRITRNPEHIDYGRGSPQISRCVCATRDGLMFVSVDHRHTSDWGVGHQDVLKWNHTFRITTWSLRGHDYTWRRDVTMYEEEFWDVLHYSGDHLFPRAAPEYPVVNIDNPDAVCFRLKKEPYNFGDPIWMIEVDMKKKALLAATSYSMETTSSNEVGTINYARVVSDAPPFSSDLPHWAGKSSKLTKSPQVPRRALEDSNPGGLVPPQGTLPAELQLIGHSRSARVSPSPTLRTSRSSLGLTPGHGDLATWGTARPSLDPSPSHPFASVLWSTPKSNRIKLVIAMLGSSWPKAERRISSSQPVLRDLSQTVLHEQEHRPGEPGSPRLGELDLRPSEASAELIPNEHGEQRRLRSRGEEGNGADHGSGELRLGSHGLGELQLSRASSRNWKLVERFSSTRKPCICVSSVATSSHVTKTKPRRRNSDPTWITETQMRSPNASSSRRNNNSCYHACTSTSTKDEEEREGVHNHHHHRRFKRPFASSSSLGSRPGWDGINSDRTSSVTALTSNGEEISVSFELVEPPGISILIFDWLKVSCPSASARLEIIAAHRDVVLFKMYHGRSGSLVDYFVYKANIDGASREHLMQEEEEEAKLTIMFGLRSKIQAHMFRSGSDDWKVFKNLQVNGANGGRDLQYWFTDAVVPYQDRFLTWVDYYQGMILADMSSQAEGKDEAPRLWHVPFPVDRVTDKPDHSDYGRGFPQGSRCVCATRDGLKFVSVDRRHTSNWGVGHHDVMKWNHTFRITTWSLREHDYTWRRDVTMYEEEF